MKVHVCKTKGCQQGAIVILDELDIPPNVKSLLVKVGSQKYSLYAVPAGSLTDCPRCGMPIAEAKEKPAPEPKKADEPEEVTLTVEPLAEEPEKSKVKEKTSPK